MGHDINIKESIEDKKSWFNIKRFKIGNTSFERPTKSLDARAVNRKGFNSITKGHLFKLREYTKVIKSYKRIEDLYNTAEDQQVNEFFYKTDWLSNMPNVLNFTFEFNPFIFNLRSHSNPMTGFLDQYYNFSKLFVSVPNIRISKKVNEDKDGKMHYKTQRIIEIDDYIRFVDFAYGVLNTKSDIPIFVPISMRMPLRELEQLIRHYLKKEYFYYWFDFEGKAVHSNPLSKLRSIFRLIKNMGYYDVTLSHFTNIKREIISNVKQRESPASDILSSIAGANIIGVNRDPLRNPKDKGVLPPPEHKARLFDEQTYYYVKSGDPDLFPKANYTIHNAVQLDQELQNQSEFFTRNFNLDELLNGKSMLTKFDEGIVLRELTAKSLDPNSHSVSLKDFL